MRQETVTIYTFDELSDDAKETARQMWRDGHLDYDWWEFIYDDFVCILEIIGYDVSERDILFSGFWSQGDGASFTGSYSYAKGAAKRIREYAPKDKELHAITDELCAMQRHNFYQVTGSISRDLCMYVHENTMQCSVERDSDNYQGVTDDAEDTFSDCSRRLAQWLYSQLEWEYEFQMSDDVIEESIIANDAEFHDDGSLA